MMDKPLQLPFSEVLVNQLFYLDGRKMVKTDDKLAWSVRNDVRCEVYEPKQEVVVTLADKKIYIPLRTRGELECRAEQIVALSLLTALNRTSNKSAPLIIDTPFARLDPKHRMNILHYVPNMASQILFLVHSGELAKDADIGEVINYVGMFLDISERWEAEARIQHLAHHDYLTGLPNRILFLEHASQAIAMARRYERKMAILFIDLDHFKPINDKYGHSIGDAVLKLVAQRLLNVVRESDTVCRQGGDEFLVLLPEWSAQESLEMLALKLLSEILKPCSVNGYQLTVSASIGIATYPDNGDSVDAIIQSADTAMYRAKAEIGNHISFARYINETHPTR